MNAIVEHTSEIQEEISMLEVRIPAKYISKLEQLKSKQLHDGIDRLVKRIILRMNSGNLDKVIALIHNITLEYSLCDGVTRDDIRICNEIYQEFLLDYDRLFDAFLPAQVRERKDQVLKITPG